MEKIRDIQPKDFNKGYYIEVSCCLCQNTASFGATTKKELKGILNAEGWKELNSDEYALIGHYCGCDYQG